MSVLYTVIPVPAPEEHQEVVSWLRFVVTPDLDTEAAPDRVARLKTPLHNRQRETVLREMKAVTDQARKCPRKKVSWQNELSTNVN